MRSPASTAPSDAAEAPTNQRQEHEQVTQRPDAVQLSLEKAESDEEEELEQLQRSPMHADAEPNRAAAEPRDKRNWFPGGRQQLLQRARHGIRRSSLQQQQLADSGERDSLMRRSSVDDFAVEIESEAAEIRTLIARTAQLWSAVDRAEHAEDLPPVSQTLQLQSVRRLSASAIQTRTSSLLGQYDCADDDSTLSSGEEEYEEEEEDEEEMSMTPHNVTRPEGYSTDEAFVGSLRNDVRTNTIYSGRDGEQRRVEEEESAIYDCDSEGSEDEIDAMDEHGELQLEQGEIMDASNRAINASKAHAIKNAMLANLIRLGFRETITLAALDAGVLEIDHYDSDCELAYVDIFMSLIKMVCDAHVDIINENDGSNQDWAPPARTTDDHNEGAGAMDADMNHSLEQRSFLPFKWPVFDMAQFEFGNARSGTCFNSVCVLTNLPKVSMDLVIPSASSTGRTKGHAFLEFDDPDMAKMCASAVDGLTWGRGPFGRIRGNLFRQYQVKSPADEQRRANAMINDGASLPDLFSGITIPGSLPDDVSVSAFEHRESSIADRFRSGVAQQQNLDCDSDDSSDAGEWVVRRPLEYGHFNPSPLLDLSSESVDIREQYESSQHEGVAMQLSWDDEEYAVQLPSDGGDDNDISASFDSNSALELQVPDEDKAMDQSLFDELVQGCRYNGSICSPARVSFSSGEAPAESSTVTSSASAYARDVLVDSGMVEQSWDVSHENEDGAEKPWRRYCEDLIVRNREMQEQVAFARRRIVQLSHNNQKLHLLIDRVERDRDGLLFENDLLQTQLHGYEDHEHHHDSLMKEVVTLRKRLKRNEHSYDGRSVNPQPQFQAAYTSTASHPLQGIRSALSHLSAASLTTSRMDELKEWEQLLESTLSHVRSVKEEKALEMQQKLDRQVEEQNELKLCVICLANEKTILCLPCRHLCLCKTCSRREEVTKCPICRLEIEEMLAVYS
ncbi:hypothetical protein PR001_g3484 [Phytophthora rubi]|uniref:RING-type domain-containing protein n=1 Tax=Phytophthora rubi TaxID=129364 RepID=A0A6A3NX84_9STRA|nr:hypothetical protein PR001_g3484 [Phytophthora rubi]